MVTRTSSSPERSGRTRAVDVERVLLEAAHRLLEREGADALTVRRVATEAGVAPMGLYHRFGGKDGLVNALFVDGFERLARALRDRPMGNALEELHAGCVQYRAFALANRALYSVMFDRIVPGLEVGPRGREACMLSFDVLIDGVRRAQASGDLRDGDPIEFAQQVWTTCHGAVSIELRDLGFVEDRAAHFDRLIWTIIAGLRATPTR